MADKPRGCLPSTLKLLLWALQCLGLLCFKRSSSHATPGRAEISVPLLLWAIFVKTFQISQFFTMMTYSHGPVTSSVGGLTQFMLFMVSFASVVVGQISLIINGPTLFYIISECEADACLKELRWPVRRLPVERFTTVLFYCSNGSWLILVLLPVFYISGPYWYDYILFCFYFCTNMVSSMLSIALFREVLTIASSKLSVDLLPLDECRSDAAGSDPRLYSLERNIRKMALLRGKIVDCFMTTITLTMCIITFMVICNLFPIIQYLAGDSQTLLGTLGTYISFTIAGISSLFHLCYSGHYFSQHVCHVCDQLRELRLEVRGQEDKAQLQYLISTLERMETFDMGSWYCLSPNTIVSVVSFVVTYLVVLLQVGGQTTHLNP